MNNRKVEDRLDERFIKRNKLYKHHDKLHKVTEPEKLKIHNHLPNNYIIGNKKALFYTMSMYYQLINENPFNYLPLTFHIQNGLEDEEYLKFLNSYYERAKKMRAIEKEDKK